MCILMISTKSRLPIWIETKVTIHSIRIKIPNPDHDIHTNCDFYWR